MIGDAGVGKTHLIYTFDKGRKPLAINPTIGIEFTSKTVRLPDSRKIRAQIWDTAGQEQFRAVTMRYSCPYPVNIGELLAHSSFLTLPIELPLSMLRSGWEQLHKEQNHLYKWDWLGINVTVVGVQ